jgi:hypothetical protein
MDVNETIERHSPEALVSIIIGLISFVILPSFFPTLTEVPRYIISSVAIVIGLIFFYYLFQPCIFFEFDERTRPCILISTDIEKRANKVSLNVFVKPKYGKICRMLFIKDSDLDHLFYQIFWHPKDALNVKRNNEYSALWDINFFPSIRINELRTVSDSKFSFKISFSPKYQEINEFSLTINRYIQSPVPWKLYLFLLFCRVKIDKKLVLITR